jgi:hypothetical protein
VNNFGQGSVADLPLILHSIEHMNALATPSPLRTFAPVRANVTKDHFRQRFQRSLRSCLRRGFCVEEAFGLIWMETLEDVPISDTAQGELYEELILWAKSC